LWLAAGTGRERFMKTVRALHEALERIGIKRVVVEAPGTPQEWQSWQLALYEFALRLFPRGRRVH
jgi:enterochelin esterase-like enzyme